MNDVSSVTIDIQGKAIEVCREDVREYESIDGITQIVGTINNFPFRPAYAITIDKSQGLTLDRVCLALDQQTRPNRTYVALSRVKSLKDLWFKRPLTASDFSVSEKMSAFYYGIREWITPVEKSA
jgi:ATP-dependent exoDNAse (exonuclease V) alpha subunit